MSYNVSIGSENFNYTSNLAPLFYDHIPADYSDSGGLHELNGLTGKKAAEVLAEAFSRIHRSYVGVTGVAPFRHKYDAANGWGSTEGALLFLARIMASCHANPRKKVSVDA